MAWRKPKQIEPLEPVWTGGRRAIGLVGWKPDQQSARGHKHRISAVMPGYGGKIVRPSCTRKTLDDIYKRGSPKYKSNSKNFSAFSLGDARERSWLTTNMCTLRAPEGYEEKGTHDPLVDGWSELSDDERLSIYKRALSLVTQDGVQFMIEAVRAKIEQRTSGGPFALRKAFKYFDRDGSGDIDPDEFFDAMAWFGLQFTEQQVIALFGEIDEDGGGTIDYYEFIGKVIGADYANDAEDEKSAATKLRPNSPPERQHSAAVCAYRQQLAIADLFEQIDSMKKGDFIQVSRTKAAELLRLANIPKVRSKDELDAYVNLVLSAIKMTSTGQLDREAFWDWWAGTRQVPGLEPFPAGGTSFAIVSPSKKNQDRIVSSTNPSAPGRVPKLRAEARVPQMRRLQSLIQGGVADHVAPLSARLPEATPRQKRLFIAAGDGSQTARAAPNPPPTPPPLRPLNDHTAGRSWGTGFDARRPGIVSPRLSTPLKKAFCSMNGKPADADRGRPGFKGKLPYRTGYVV